MARLFLWIWFAAAAALTVVPVAAQQPDYSSSSSSETAAASPAQAVPFWRKIDWRDPRNIAMGGLGIGSLIIVKIAFRKMIE